METNLEPRTLTATSDTSASVNAGHFVSPPSPPPLHGDYDDDDIFIDDSNCSTPYVSAPSSPGRSYFPSGFFYSAPTSPMHFILATAQARSSAGGGLIPATSDASSNGSFEFEFSARFDSPAPEIGSSMSSADELFLNGQIRPMKLCAHLQRPQRLPSLTLLESEREDEEDDEYGEDEKSSVFQRARLRNRSQRRRTRSLSPLRSTGPYEWYCSDDAVSSPKKASEEETEAGGGEKEKEGGAESEATPSGSSSRCSSAGRSSKRWVFLKDFLRSKSEGRSNNKFWHNINISFSPAKEKREKGSSNVNANENVNVAASCSEDRKAKKKEIPATKGKALPTGKRRSAHEMHYAANRAQAEEMRKKTFLPYRQGLLGCLGFNSKSYGALNGFARALNPVSSG